MRIEDFISAVGADFYAGVPDSQLRALCDYLYETYGLDYRCHVVAANEGNAVALAAGHFLATGRVPVVYMQNSGEGNAVNPIASLLSRDVYSIPVLFIIGWRGEPGVHDEPQHVYQGKITLKLLEDMEIPYFTVGADTSVSDVSSAMERFRKIFSTGGQAAFVIRKGAFSYGGKTEYPAGGSLLREDAVRIIAAGAAGDPIVSTTGKISRELFEIREAAGEGHERDFLTVGSMGHASSIALGIAMSKPEARIWCIDGDGAALMHMGAMAVIGASGAGNLVHVVLNNCAHESVGGMPTVADRVDFPAIARASGYCYAASVSDEPGLLKALAAVKGAKGPSFIEVRVSLASRLNLGRPTSSPAENKAAFVKYLQSRQGN